jgi:hypothetical protein
MEECRGSSSSMFHWIDRMVKSELSQDPEKEVKVPNGRRWSTIGLEIREEWSRIVPPRQACELGDESPSHASPVAF